MDRLEMVEMGRDVEDSKSYGMAVAKAVRAIQESMISHHFGEGIVDSLFQQYERLVVEEMAREEMITDKCKSAYAEHSHSSGSLTTIQYVRLWMVEMGRDVEDSKSYGMAVAKAVRAIQESMISHHFGEGIVDSLFQQYERLVVEEMAREEMITVSFVIVLGKK
ncbi:hypothetical protein TEA_001168 [Camellia sinensis var. sinensis]|uniref:Uncharacterized protein n=1 Tax=Camellia sinensis var. sinensis TaxID=542762 RepID=A0A4S4DAI5_CAMSN|nr:hypothetical protein TEA_001168 [Camellia sinensis var. sinensis]